ncbi:MAG: hypothetical protein GY834_01820, partial [Bacteroidetes bacterium]|nr:hypothetical protein [Bacteroidota bacterium]
RLLKNKLEDLKTIVDEKTIDTYKMTVHQKDLRCGELLTKKSKIEYNFLNQKDKTVEGFANQILNANSITYDKRSKEYKYIVRSVYQMVLAMVDYEVSSIRNDFNDSWALENILKDTDSTETKIEGKTDKLKTVINEYLTERENLKAINPRSLVEEIAILKLFSDIVGNITIKNLDDEAVKKYKRTLFKLPPHRSKRKELIGKSVKELLEMNLKPIGNRTVENHCQKIKSFLIWLVDQHYINSNYSKILSVKTKKSKRQSTRTYFTEHDLKIMFSPDNYPLTSVDKRNANDANYWVPIIGLFTGARLNEICQLMVDDVRQAKNIWVFDFNSDGIKKSLKTDASARLVPIHKQIIDLDFLDYLKLIKKLVPIVKNSG